MAKNLLWFAEADVDLIDEALMTPASGFLGCRTENGGVAFYFDSMADEASRDIIVLSCTNGNQKTVMNAFISLLTANSHASGGMITVADFNVANGQQAIGAHKVFDGLVTAVAIN